MSADNSNMTGLLVGKFESNSKIPKREQTGLGLSFIFSLKQNGLDYHREYALVYLRDQRKKEPKTET